MAAFSDLSEDGLDGLMDDEIVDRELSGTLSFSSDVDGIRSMQKDNSLSAIVPEEFRTLVGKPGPISITFDVIDARIEVKQHEKYVIYTILLIRSAGMDSMPAKIERRYTDFSALNSALRKRYPQFMKEIAFPAKRIGGNYRADTIACRSRAFEQYLSHLFSIEAIRTSIDFTDFFYGNSLREGYRLIQNARYVDAIPLLLSTWKLQTKLLGDFQSQTISTLCAVVTCHAALEQERQAETYAELALESIAGDDQNLHLVPLLKLSIRLCWKLGKDKKRLESRLLLLKEKGVDVDGAPSLLEQMEDGPNSEITVCRGYQRNENCRKITEVRC